MNFCQVVRLCHVTTIHKHTDTSTHTHTHTHTHTGRQTDTGIWGRSISNAPDPLPVVWSSSNFACAMTYIFVGYVMGYSFELIVVCDLQVFELSQVWNGPCWVSPSDPVFVFERTHTTEDFWWNERNLWWYGDNAPSYDLVKCWHREFKHGRKSVETAPESRTTRRVAVDLVT